MIFTGAASGRLLQPTPTARIAATAKQPASEQRAQDRLRIAGEQAHAIAPDLDPDLDPDRPVRDAVVVEAVGESVFSVGDLPERPAQELLRIVLDEPGVETDLARAEAADGLLEPGPADLVGRHLGQQIAASLVRRPDVGQQEVARERLDPGLRVVLSLVALLGWIFVFATTPPAVIAFGLGALPLRVGCFGVWWWKGRTWPFEARRLEA